MLLFQLQLQKIYAKNTSICYVFDVLIIHSAFHTRVPCALSRSLALFACRSWCVAKLKIIVLSFTIKPSSRCEWMCIVVFVCLFDVRFLLRLRSWSTHAHTHMHACAHSLCLLSLSFACRRVGVLHMRNQGRMRGISHAMRNAWRV